MGSFPFKVIRPQIETTMFSIILKYPVYDFYKCICLDLKMLRAGIVCLMLLGAAAAAPMAEEHSVQKRQTTVSKWAFVIMISKL